MLNRLSVAAYNIDVTKVKKVKHFKKSDINKHPLPICSNNR
jgi:hypothetical protein